MVNFAHGDLMTAGAFICLWAVGDVGAPLLLAYPIALAAMLAIGVAIASVAAAPLRGRPPAVAAITTFGAALVIRTLLALWQGSDPKALASPVGGDVFRIGGVIVSHHEILVG